MIRLARIISNALNPLVMFVGIITALVYYSTGNPQTTIKWFVFSSLFSLMCTVFILLAVRRRIFSNFDVSKQRERPMLFLIAACIVGGLIVLGFLTQVNRSVLSMFLVGFLGIGIYAFVNRKIKASAHLGVFIIFATIMTVLFNAGFVILYPLALILAWARVQEREHTKQEVIVGAGLGFILSLLLIFLLQ